MRLLDGLSRAAAPVVSESRFSLGDIGQMLFDGQRYIVGPSGSKPGQVDQNFVSYVQQINNRHGVVAAAVTTRALLLSQVRFLWRRPDGSTFGNRDLAPLERPGPTTRPGLLMRLEQDVSFGGTAVVGRRGSRLFRLPPNKTRLVLGSDSEPTWSGDEMVAPFDAEVVAVLFDPNEPGAKRRVDPTVFGPGEFAVWAPEPDPLHSWRGQSWVTSVVREVLLDGQVTDHEGKFFEHAATPSLVFMMDPDRSADEVRSYAEIVNTNHGGLGNAYKNMFLGGATDVKVVGTSMKDLGLDELQGTYENRVAVRSRIPASVLGTKESLSGSSLNAGNYGAARRLLADGWFTPTVEGLSASLESVVVRPDDAELTHDPDRVLFLQEDQKDSADIMQTNAVAARQLVEAGYEPSSVIDALTSGDMKKLKHTGNVSVQLQPPGSGTKEVT